MHRLVKRATARESVESLKPALAMGMVYTGRSKVDAKAAMEELLPLPGGPWKR